MSPTRFERDRDRLTAALNHPGAHGPALQRVAGRVVDELPEQLLEDLLRILEAPGRRAALLESERLSPSLVTRVDSETTEIEGLIRSTHERAAVVEDLALRRALRA